MIKKYLGLADFSTDPLVPLLFAEVLCMMHKPNPLHHHYLNLQLAVGRLRLGHLPPAVGLVTCLDSEVSSKWALCTCGVEIGSIGSG